MKARCLVPFMLLCAALACLTSCEKVAKFALDKAMENVVDHNYQDSEEWGKVVTQDLDLKSFDRVDLSGSVRLEYTQDTVCTVQVYGNEKCIEAYTLAVKNGELVVSLNKGTSNVTQKTPRITVRVTAPVLLKASCSGAAEMLVKNITQDEELRLVSSGAVNMNIENCDVRSFEARVSGAGDIKLDSVRATGDAELNVSGAGDITGVLSCQNLRIEVTGAGDSDLDINCQQAKVYCSGAADLKLTGKCASLDLDSGRSSDVNTKGLTVGEK